MTLQHTLNTLRNWNSHGSNCSFYTPSGQISFPTMGTKISNYNNKYFTEYCKQHQFLGTTTTSIITPPPPIIGARDIYNFSFQFKKDILEEV